jgi:hypothetical protein
MNKVLILVFLLVCTNLFGRSDGVLLVYRGYSKVESKGNGYEDKVHQSCYLLLEMTNAGELDSAHVIEYGKYYGKAFLFDPYEIPFTKNIIDIKNGAKQLNLVASFSGDETLVLFLEGLIKPRIKTGIDLFGLKYENFVAPSLKGQLVSYSSSNSFLSKWNLRLDTKMTYQANNAKNSLFTNTATLPDLNYVIGYLYYVKLKKYQTKQVANLSDSQADSVTVSVESSSDFEGTINNGSVEVASLALKIEDEPEISVDSGVVSIMRKRDIKPLDSREDMPLTKAVRLK